MKVCIKCYTIKILIYIISSLYPQTVHSNEEDPFPIIEHIGDYVVNRNHSRNLNLSNYFADEDSLFDFEDLDELHHPCDDEFRINLLPLLDIQEENEEFADNENSENAYVQQEANVNDINDDYESDWNDIDGESEADIEIEIIIEYENDELNDF